MVNHIVTVHTKGPVKDCTLCYEQKEIPIKFYSTHYGIMANIFSCCVDCELRATYPAMTPTLGCYATSQKRKEKGHYEF